MLEARSFVESFDKAKEVLASLHADFKGEYVIHDVIFASKDANKTLIDEFLRLRMVPKNIWDDKAFIVVIKNTELKEVGKNSIVPIKKQFDFEADARQYIEENFLDKFEYSFEFTRTGWQYYAGKYFVDLEDIEGHLSIEAKAETEQDLKDLVELLNMRDVIKGPSVLAVKGLLKK